MHPALFALKRGYQAARHALEVELQREGLSVAQLEILNQLSVSPEGVDQRALQAAAGITSATMTRLLAGMQRRGLVARSPHPTDARGKTVTITPMARRLSKAMVARCEAAFNARLLHGFSKAETQQLISMLGRIASNMGGDD